MAVDLQPTSSTDAVYYFDRPIGLSYDRIGWLAGASRIMILHTVAILMSQVRGWLEPEGGGQRARIMNALPIFCGFFVQLSIYFRFVSQFCCQTE